MTAGDHNVRNRPQAVTPRETPPPARRRFLWLFATAMVLVAGTAFVMKLIDFIVTATNEGPDALASFLIPVLNYLLVAAGFLCLFLWAWLTGQMRDVESPKYRMLEMQKSFDDQSANAGAEGSR